MSFQALTGNETFQVQGQDGNGFPSAGTFLTTTGLVAQLAAKEGSLVETAITTAGNGTLTGVGLVGGQIARSGPTGAYTDTTETAAQIVAALPGFVSGATFVTRIKNATAFVQTLQAGSGVTLPATVIVAPFSVYQMFGKVGGTKASPTIVFTHMSTSAIADSITATAASSTALSTVGAGTITAAGIVGGVTARGGVQIAAFTDTTDVATAIIAAQPGLVNKIGTSFLYTYVNNTIFPATLQGGIGVTVSGVTVLPANSWAEYLVTYTAAGTITMVGIKQGYFPSTGTYVNNGATSVTVANTAVTAGSIISFTLKTVGGTVSASAPNVKTITPGTGFTVAGLASDTSTYNYEIRG